MRKIIQLPVKAGPLKPSPCPVCGDTRGYCIVNVKVVPPQVWQRPVHSPRNK